MSFEKCLLLIYLMINNFPGVRCSATQFRCRDGSKCVPSMWKCDAMNDCRDGCDEKNCPNEGNDVNSYKLKNIIGVSSTQHDITNYPGFSREWRVV